MYDPTPPPLRDVTRRWTQFDDSRRDHHVARLLENGCPDRQPAHVARPVADDGACYAALLAQATAGNEVAVGWLATTHRPLFITRGRVLLEHDPGEWGGLCLEVLLTTAARESRSPPGWLRRRVTLRISQRLRREVARHLDRRGFEKTTDPDLLPAWPALCGWQEWESALDLRVTLSRHLGRLDAATRDGLIALAKGEPLAAVADRYGLPHATVRQRVTRARHHLQPRLARYRRTAA